MRDGLRRDASAHAPRVRDKDYRVVSLIVPRLVQCPLDCTDPGALLATYWTRFFLRIAFADAAALVGFVLADSWWLYPLGAAFAFVGFVRLAPTERNLQRDQEALTSQAADNRSSKF
jgi:hypothetical protein